MFLCNISWLSTNYMVLHSRSQNSSLPPLRKPKILRDTILIYRRSYSKSFRQVDCDPDHCLLVQEVKEEQMSNTIVRYGEIQSQKAKHCGR
jgi:hypothetical protein